MYLGDMTTPPLKIFEYIYLHVYINNINIINVPEGELCEE